MKYDYIFWDWNGTLFNDAQAAWLAVNDMLVSRKLNAITFEQYRDYIDVPIVRFYERVMDMSKESMESLSVEFNTLWEKHLSASPLAEGVNEILDEISALGIKQYIFSSSQNKMIIPQLERFGIFGYFDRVLGANDCYVGSKAERTRDFLQINNIHPSSAVFIGDMVHDREVAALIGSDCILVSNGHQCENALQRTGAPVINSLFQLKQLLY